MPKYYSESGEDRKLDTAIKLPEKGFYVDIGAAHPTRMSNTAFLRDKGWEGIQIDGDPYWERYWEKEGLSIITTPIWTDNIVTFAPNKSAHRLSKIADDGVKMESTKLNTVLKDHKVKHIDFMSLDVEGYEFDIFMSLEDKYYPDVFIFEFDTVGERDYRLRDYINGLGAYHQFLKTKNNFVYVKKDSVRFKEGYIE
jgi:hypothetical protein